MVKFDQIAQQLRGEIVAGTHGLPGDRFMTVRQLAQRFGVSLTTAQKATKVLRNKGLLIANSTSPAKIGPAAAPAESRPGTPGSSPHRLGLVVRQSSDPRAQGPGRSTVAEMEGSEIISLDDRPARRK